MGAPVCPTIESQTDGQVHRADHNSYPFSAFERRVFLVVPLATDITPAQRALWESPVYDPDDEASSILAYRRYRVDWRNHIADEGQASGADVLNRRKHVHLTSRFSTGIVEPRGVEV